MRDAMAHAEVGDDVYGEDPTVARLEAMVAEIVGQDSALFVPSGTMANQIAIRSLTRPGDVLLAGENAHVLRYESGAAAAFSGVQIQTVGAGGLFDCDQLRAAIPVRDVHHAPATAVALENTHNVSGGRVWPTDVLGAVMSMAHERGLSVHLDGARIFNAACAAKTTPAVLAAGADTVSFCLSKGLGAPVGSLVCAAEEHAEGMRRLRKMFGGGMRQAGVLAAAGIYALEHHVDRIETDHRNASTLATGLAGLGLEVERPPETNIVVFAVPANRFHHIANAAGLSKALRERDVLINPMDATRLRAVTHLDVSGDEISDLLERIEAILVQAPSVLSLKFQRYFFASPWAWAVRSQKRRMLARMSSADLVHV